MYKNKKHRNFSLFFMYEGKLFIYLILSNQYQNIILKNLDEIDEFSLFF